MGRKLLFSIVFNFLIVAFVLLFPNPSLAATCTSSHVRFASSSNILYVTGPVDCTLSDIKSIRPTAPLDLVDSTNKIWLLKTNLKLEQGAILHLRGASVGGDVNELRLRSNNNSSSTSTIWIRAQWGTIDIDSTKITSWNETANAPDTEYSSYKRSYIQVKSYLDGSTPRESRMDIKNSDIGYLGYNAAESYGLSWKVLGPSPGVFETVNIYGDVINNQIHHNYFGVYMYGAYGMNITGNAVHDNVKYGLDPHDDSDYLVIDGNDIYNNGNHGIICSKRCDHITIRNNNVRESTGNGIFLHSYVNDSVVENNTVHDNSDSGIALFDSHRNSVRNNTSFSNNHGMRLSVGSSENVIENNELADNSSYGLYFYKGSDTPTSGDGRPKLNIIRSNNLHDNGSYVVKAQEADSNVFEGNQFSGNARELIINNADNNVFKNNAFTGSNNFYYGQSDSDNSIVDTDSFSVKLSDSASSMQLINSQNAILQNNKNIPTTAEPTSTSILFTRALSSSIVSFKRLNFILIPTSAVLVSPTTWQITSPFDKKFTESAQSGVSGNHVVADLKPSTTYRVLVDSALLNSYISDGEGKISFTYSGYNGSTRTFEVKQ